MTRVKDVIDCWFDSGSMPYAQYHYPFENEEIYKDQYPADFICEGIDQTRGWFYSLIAISTFLNKESCYKNVLVNDLILDAEGRKMSKSRGNTVNPFELFDQFGADALRWYMLHVSPVWTPTKFDVEGLKEVKSKFFDTLRNVYNFFALYANTDNVDPKTFYIEPKDRDEIDKWILSKYNKLVKDATEAMDDYDMTRTVKRIQQFVNEDLSNWYIRRNRRRFWGSELTDDKKAVFNTAYEVLRGVCLLAAPFAPYLPEDIYRNLTGEVSVHLGDYPIYDESLINEKIEERMDLVRELVSIGRSAREDAQIKVRQPLSAIHIDGRYEELISGLIPLMKEELNVQQVRFEKDLSEFMDFSLKPNYKTAGPVLGPKVKLLAQSLQNADANCLVKELEENGSIDVNISQEIIKIDKDLLDIRISAKEGFNVQTENNLFVILDTHLTEELLQEGLARELISKVQQMRKNSGFEVMDRIDILLNCPQEIKDAVASFDAFIKKETLADDILFTDEDYEAVNLNGYDCTVKVVKK
jgi:isoleucyl-tRNA synthetase